MDSKDALILSQQNRVAELEAIVLSLTEKINEIEVKKTSSNSSLPPSQDLTRKNQSLRKKSGKKSGGQSGHEGSTLTFTGTPDVIEEVRPNFYTSWGSSLSDLPSTIERVTHTIDIEIKRKGSNTAIIRFCVVMGRCILLPSILQ